MREKVSELYFDYQLTEHNQDWKYKWFYIHNHPPQLPKPSTYAPVDHALWNVEPTFAEYHQVPELLNRIADLKKKGLTAERVAFSFMKWRVQPLMKWEHLRYEYIGAEDELRLSQEELSNDEIVLRL